MNDQSPDLARLHVTVQGRVQGVGFRAFVEETAENLGLTGWVRNRWNGDVEVLAEGSRKDLEILLRYLQTGPRMSNVTTLIPAWEPATGEFKSFGVRRTD